MKKTRHKPFRWAVIFTVILALFATYVLMDTFMIARPGVPVSGATAASAATSTTSSALPTGETSADVSESETAATTTPETTLPETVETTPQITATSYQDSNIKITIETVYKYDTAIYVADIQISHVSYLKTAFAKGTYGRNIKAFTSEMASSNNAIFAINGDYYGFRNYGFVLRNGVLYRSSARQSGIDEALLIDRSGNFSIINERKSSATDLADAGAWQILSFGPALVENGEVSVSAKSEVSQAMGSNPRTAVGQVSALHYIFIVSDGRTSESKGLSLLNLAEEFTARDCTVAYNLDGGGSATMWFNGQIVNNPTDGRSDTERNVSDIVYIGYQ